MGVEAGTTKDDFSDYFTKTILSTIRDKNNTTVVDVGSIKPQVAGSKEIFSFIQTYLYWLELKLPGREVVQSLLEGAAKLVALDELEVATIFFEKCIQAVDALASKLPGGDSTTKRSSNDAFLVRHKVESLYGIAACRIKVSLRKAYGGAFFRRPF